MAKALKGFSTDLPADLDAWSMPGSKPRPEDFPVPELVLLALRDVMGCHWSGQGEKVRWSVYASVEGEPVVFELRKFGFTICQESGAKVPLSRIVGQLKSALKVLEPALEPIAQAQIALGNVTLANRLHEFQDRYYFFRGKADEAYARAQTRLPVQPDAGFSGLTAELNRKTREKHEGFFYSTAMVDAYFSLLEHELPLLRAFTGRPLAEGELRALLAAKWDEKLKGLVPVERNPHAQALLGRLRAVKERIRNPFAHGGVENDGGSLFVHMPGVGALPANFSRFRHSVRFQFIPIESADHESACQLFDEVDLLLRAGDLELPHRMLEAGLDPAFDQESLSAVRRALEGGHRRVEDYLEVKTHEWERHANMDY